MPAVPTSSINSIIVSSLDSIYDTAYNTNNPLQSVIDFALQGFKSEDTRYTFAGFKLDVVEQEKMTIKSILTEHPVPSGDRIGQYIVKGRKEIQLIGKIADVVLEISKFDNKTSTVQNTLRSINGYANSSIITSAETQVSKINQQVSQFVGFVDGAVQQGKSVLTGMKQLLGGSENIKNTQKMISILEAILIDKQIKFSISAFGMQKDNMVLTNAEFNRDPLKMDGVVDVNLYFTELVEVSDVYTTFTTEVLQQSLNQQRSKAVHKGKSAGETTGLKSLLFKTVF